MTATPIMTLFAEWNALRDRSDEPGLSAEEVTHRCDETDEAMARLLALPPQNAADLAAKVMCFTHYGNYSLEEFQGGDELMQEMAALVGQPDKLTDRFRTARLCVHNDERAAE